MEERAGLVRCYVGSIPIPRLAGDCFISIVFFRTNGVHFLCLPQPKNRQ